MTLFFFRHAFQIKKVAKYSQGVKQVQVMCVVWACCGFLSCSAAWSADQNILVELSKQRCSYQECQWRYMGLQFEEFLSHHTLGSSVSPDLQPVVCEHRFVSSIRSVNSQRDALALKQSCCWSQSINPTHLRWRAQASLHGRLIAELWHDKIHHVYPFTKTCDSFTVLKLWEIRKNDYDVFKRI